MDWNHSNYDSILLFHPVFNPALQELEICL